VSEEIPEKARIQAMAKRLLVSIGMVLLLVRTVPAQGKYTDPDSPAVQAAARVALANAKVLDIIGVSSGVIGVSSGVIGVSSGVKGVMEDLGAKVTEQEITIELAADFLFDFDKYVLKAEAIPSLRKVGEVVKAYPKAPLLIEGHTDGKGTHPYNMKLSENRALSVKNWLVQNAGVDPARITTAGLAETKPVAPNTNPDGSDNPQGRQKNRRVSFTLRTKT
jgi:outer membrane protein OmpA-like peptidoglycan-associated protein